MTWLFDALWTSVCCGAAAVLLTLLTPLLQKRYSARMRCWVWIAIAVFLLVPVRPDFGAAPIKVNVPETFTRTITLRQPQALSAPQSSVQTAAPQSGESAAAEPETPVTNETQAAQELPVGGESADQTTQPQTGNVQTGRIPARSKRLRRRLRAVILLRMRMRRRRRRQSLPRARPFPLRSDRLCWPSGERGLWCWRSRARFLTSCGNAAFCGTAGL